MKGVLEPDLLKRSRRLEADAVGRRVDLAGIGGGAMLAGESRSTSESYGC